MKINTTTRKARFARSILMIAIITAIIAGAAGTFWALNANSSCKATYIRHADKSSSGEQDCAE